eukprot:EG_transcript_29430
MPLTKADHGTTILAVKGEVLELTLVGNPTTGYQWLPARKLPENSELKDLGSTYKVDEPELCGSPGVYTFKYEVQGPGTIALEYRRDWEGAVPALEVFEVQVALK